MPLGQQLEKHDAEAPLQRAVKLDIPLDVTVCTLSVHSAPEMPTSFSVHMKGVGTGDGARVGLPLGRLDGPTVGVDVGRREGATGAVVGRCVGAAVGVQGPPAPLEQVRPGVVQTSTPLRKVIEREGQQLEWQEAVTEEARLPHLHVIRTTSGCPGTSSSKQSLHESS